MASSAAEVIDKARELMVTVCMGLEMAGGDNPPLRPSGIHNVAVFGRSVTLTLQNLRTLVDRQEFDAWYTPHVEAMKADPVFGYFKGLRNEILKEGPPRLSTRTQMRSFDTADIWRYAPPGARSFFAGDRHGGSGWHVQLPDGTMATFYTNPPFVTTTLHLPDAPDDRPIVDLCRMYIERLGALVDDAAAHFMPSSS